jgi:hypothetical protein
MAYPTILFDSVTGDDTNASGAGPATAITSSSGSTDAAGTVVTIPNANLSAVAVDGSHAVYISGQGLRSITAVADSGLSTANVTVGTAFTGSLTSQTVAIGGKRQYLFGSTRSEIESSCEAGWTLSLAAGHTENLTATTSYNFGNTSSNPIRIIGDETDRATFISVHSAFSYSFNFSPSTGLIVKNCNFEHYRGSDTSGNLEAYNVIYCPTNSMWINCNCTVRRMYSRMAMFYTRYNHSVTFINCAALVTEDSTFKYTRATGFDGRTFSCIRCTTRYCLTGMNLQVFSGYVGSVVNCEIDAHECIRSYQYSYTHGSTFSHNICKVNDGGSAFWLPSNWNYSSTGRFIITNNVCTSDGTYTHIRTYTTNPAMFNNRVLVVDNCFHGGTADSDIQSDAQVNTITTDPELSGDVGSFALGSQEVIDHVGVSAGISSGGGGATVHPLYAN